jgi:hypothetical protein
VNGDSLCDVRVGLDLTPSQSHTWSSVKREYK